jgi:hypothetical protein
MFLDNNKRTVCELCVCVNCLYCMLRTINVVSAAHVKASNTTHSVFINRWQMEQ